VCRNNFTEVGKLGNISDTNFRAINDNLPVMAFALDLGNITQSENPLVFAMGLFMDPAIYYLPCRASTTEVMHMAHRSLWQCRWGNIWEAVRS